MVDLIHVSSVQLLYWTLKDVNWHLIDEQRVPQWDPAYWYKAVLLCFLVLSLPRVMCYEKHLLTKYTYCSPN